MSNQRRRLSAEVFDWHSKVVILAMVLFPPVYAVAMFIPMPQSAQYFLYAVATVITIGGAVVLYSRNSKRGFAYRYAPTVFKRLF